MSSGISEDLRFMTVNKQCLLLIVVAGMERFVFKGLACNLVTYLTDVMKMSNSSAARTVSCWSGFTSMLPLVVAPLVDAYWDHYSTILASSFVYFLGLLALVSSTLNKQNPSSLSLYFSLYLISLGQGGYNPSLQAFGANQIETQHELPTNEKYLNSNKKSQFFQWWYFGICSGTLLGVSIMPNVQDLVGWGLGFAVSAMVMVMSISLFLWNGRLYSRTQDKRINVDINLFKRIVTVVKGLKSSKKATLAEIELEGKPLCVKEDNNGGETGSSDQSSGNNNHMLKIMKVVIRLLPIWTSLLMFAVIFQQPTTFFIKQGMTMKRNIGKSYNLPPATLQSAITISIVLLMPFYDSIFIPVTRFILRNEKGITTMQRIGIGMFLSVIAMAFAATLETKRREYSESGSGRLSIFCLLPQYILLGISDIFTVVGMQEFFYSEVPAEMKTMGIALYTSVFGVGSFLSALMVFLVERFTGGEEKNENWLSDDMTKARLDKYYWMLTCITCLSFIGFLLLCRLYKRNV